MSRKTELAKNTAILTVGKLCTQCISFFLLPLYTAILSTEEYGTFDLLVTYSALLLPLVNWQLDQGLFRFMLDYRGNKEEESKLLSTLLFSSMMQSVVYFGMYLIITPKLHIENAYFLLLYVILQVFYSTVLAVCKGIRRKCQIYGSILYLGNNNDNIKCYCFGYFENGTPRIVCFHVICTDCYINLFDICIKMLGIYFSKKYSPEYI